MKGSKTRLNFETSIQVQQDQQHTIGDNDYLQSRVLIKDRVQDIITQTPGPKDILFGRGNGVFPHIGNRVFRKVIDIHIYDYVSSQSRRYKTAMVHSIVNLFHDNGYRFLKHNSETGSYNIIAEAQTTTKIGHALRDRSRQLGSICREKLMTRTQLLQKGLSILNYAEFLTRQKEMKDEYDCSRSSLDSHKFASTKETKTRGKNAQQLTSTLSSTHSTVAAHCTISDSNIPCPCFGTSGTEFEQEFRRAKKTAAMCLIPSAKRSEKEDENGGFSQGAPQNIRRTINEIVVPTMKNGDLPTGGYWKFFPLQEIEGQTLDMGPSMNGWKLKLDPISFQANPIFLNIV